MYLIQFIVTNKKLEEKQTEAEKALSLLQTELEQKEKSLKGTKEHNTVKGYSVVSISLNVITSYNRNCT